MAEIIAAYAVPHTPSFVADVAERGERSETLQFFQRIKAHFDRSALDVLVMIQNDHFNTFFLDNWPTFAIGIAGQTQGPNDQTPMMPRYQLAMQSDLARKIYAQCIASDFDFSSSEELDVDHGVLVPLQFLTPKMNIPIVPIFINCVVPPLPSAQRCYLLGRCLAEAIRQWDSPLRIGVIVSGSLSLEIGGPRAELGKTFGVPDKEWAAWTVDCVRHGKHAELIVAATPQRMARAGNVAGELLNWIALLGMIGDVHPDIVIEQPELGNAFAAWSLHGQPA